MSPRPLSSKRCTKGGTTSRHWLAAVLAVALIGFAGSAFADASKVAPIGVEKLQPVRVNSDQDPTGVPPSSGEPRAPGSPAVPSNDECSGAIAIPDGPYPIDSVAVDAIDATPQGADDGGLFPATCNPSGTDYTVWYTFTPSVTTLYTFTTCPATGATGNTVLDTVIAVFSSSDGTCGGAMTSLGCNDSAACASPGDPSTFQAILNAGTTYYVVAGHWVPDGAIPPTNSTYVIQIDRSNAPGNDTCAGAVDIPLNRVVLGTTAAANNDFQAPLACFSGIAGTQTPSNAPGRDVVFTFTAPAAGKYSIRQVTSDPTAVLRGQNPVLYAADNCPAGGGEVGGCIAAVNRVKSLTALTDTGFNNNQSEELYCLSMTAGQQIYVFFDDGGTGAANGGGPLGLEATPCVQEVEPNDTTATATASPGGFCDTEGSSSVEPSYHCVLGANAGASCITTNVTAGVANCGGAPGLCFPDSICEAGHQPGTACVPTCVGGPTPGAVCTATAQCGSGGACQTSGGCGICTSGLNAGQACVNNANCGAGGVCNIGVCSRVTNEGDVDFWSLGTPAAGSKVYTVVHAPMANDNDFRVRVTSDTETLGFDDDDGHTRTGSLSATLSGPKTTGTETFVRVSRTLAMKSEPYRLHAIVQPPIAAAQPEGTASPDGEGWDITYGWPGDGLFADYLSNGANTGYIRGSFFHASDGDCYKTLANEGDSLMWFGDSNPDWIAGTGINSNPQIIIYDAAAAGISNFVFGTGVSRNIGPFSGNTGLDRTTPQSTSFFQHWRARYTGMFELCFYGFTTALNTGPFPLFYAGSMTANCGPMQVAGPGSTTTDVGVTKTGPGGTVPTSGVFDFTITITNNGSQIAQEVNLIDQLPAELLYLGLTVDDGFGGNNSACLSLPTPGSSDAPIDCTTMSLAPGASATYTLTVQVAPCGPGGVLVTNTASISTVSTDPDPSNDSDSDSITTEENNSCTVLLCDASGCIVDACAINDHCEAGACVSDPLNCDDGTVCTDDSCNSVTGCVNDPTPGQQCDDGNVCTGDFCDPVNGCVFPPAAGGIACNDFFNCTTDDACDGFGNCTGVSVCNDGNSCTEDFADEFNNCACFNFPTGEGAPCNDGNACTEGEICDANVTCVGGTPVTCDDSDPCTTDSCDTGSGCVYTPVSCDDGNACTSDSCDSGTGACSYTPVICNDNNGCTDDSCDPGSGCVYAPNTAPCDDGDACTTGDACGGGSCQPGAAIVCDDGNGCTDDSCDPGSGCVYTNNTAPCDDGNACTNGDACGGGSCLGGAPTVCTPLDQCHDAGVCDPGSGLCSNPAKPDGTTCDDGNPTTTGDVCTAGICAGSSCPDAPDPKTHGWYKSLCLNSHSGDSLTAADAACVASITDTFSGISTVADICNVIHPGVAEGSNGDICGREEDELMVLALNICKQRLCGAFAIDSNCGDGGNADVGASLAEMDAIFSDPGRDRDSCTLGGCLGREINNGRALELNTLSLAREGGSFRLNWLAPSIDDGQGAPKNYTVWRRQAGTMNPFQQIGSTTGLTFVDATGGTTSWQYLVKVHH